uniref:SFRICE_020879 n=1 Tax=Spodoptera frugiperda TaxID=7108 RepID=A0A2H1VXK6_SPOFR
MSYEDRSVEKQLTLQTEELILLSTRTNNINNMSLADLFQNQNEIYDNIKKIGINIKKDGWDRKNADYFKRRKAMLENLWSEFQFNHDRLTTEQSGGHPYFANDCYNITLQCYNEVKELILQQHQQLTSLARSPREQPVQIKAAGGANQLGGEGTAADQTKQEQEASTSERAEQASDANRNREPSPSRTEQITEKKDMGSNSKLDDMMRKQTANFKAFMRAVANIHVEFLTEKWELQDALQTLQSRWSAIDNLHWEIECETNGEKMIVYDDRYTRYENQFQQLKRALNTKMWSGTHREKTTPKLEIPVFHGNYNQWIPFKDLFTEAIHNNNSLSSAQKMQFLKSKVQGEAERLIQHLQISSDNYLVCWEILNHRYNNEKLIFTSHINMLFNLPNMQQQTVAQLKRIHDVTIETLYAIKNLGVNVDTWDPILVHILSQKLDADTHSEYHDSLKDCRKLPKLKDLLDFLEAKFTSLEASRRKQENNQKPNTSSGQQQNHSYFKKQYSSNQASSNKKITKSFHVSTIRCPICDGEHGMYNCARFLEMPIQLKLNTVNKMNICVNCLFSHNGKKCTSAYRCRICAGQHNTLLHDAFIKNKPERPTNTSHVSKDDDTSEILLATAVVNVETDDGTQIQLRALIDQGSQISLITEHAAQLLGSKREKCKGVIFGVGQRENHCKGMTTITCSSVYNDFKFQTSVFIMNNLIKNLPNNTFTKPSWSHLQNINLADPEFNNSRKVDLLFGADIYSQIILGGIIKGVDATQPIAQQTHLGWLLCGNVKTFHCNVVINNLDDIKQFWESEDIVDHSNISTENEACIEFYSNTTQRLGSGKYVVRLPMKEDFESRLGRLASDEREQFPEAAKVLEESFYMDDLVHGTHTIEHGKKLIADLKRLLKNGGFNLRKWSANNQEILEDISEQQNNDKIVFNFKTENTQKTLGLCWNSREDKFTFQCTISEVNKKQTKRRLLAEISKLFDPLGWLAPVSTKLKLLFQKLWDGNLQWDDEVPDNIHAEWCKIQADVRAINSCEIPRWLNCGQKQKMELHGFSDASMDAYACVIYAKVQSSTVLVAAKSKIVPHRKTTTLPRLELNGAHLLSQLMRKVKQSLNQPEVQAYGWTDSMVVLGWLQGDPARWHTYVGNRVRSITDVIPQCSWNYVKTKENPADAASRGQYASQLKENQLWWQGPTWLPSLKTNNIEKHNYSTNQEEKSVQKQANATQHTLEKPSIVEKLLQNYSCIEHIIRIVAWILRALNPKRRQLPSYLTLHELDNATKVLAWKNEYLSQLTIRSKWHKPQKNIEIGDLVIVHDDHTPAGKWLMGRITELHPGNDGYVRVVSLKTKNGLMKRPVTKLSILPINGGDTAEQQNSSNTNKNESDQQTNSKSQNLHRCKTTNRKINFIGLVLTLLYLLNPAAAANKTNIVELQQGLYFDKVTNMQLIRGEWKIIVYYDIEPYWHGIAASRKFTNHLENICEKIKQKTQCNVILTQLQHSINEIRHYNNVLLNPQGRANTRSKRGLINGIGSVARSLFGVLDDEFAKQYQEDIDLIKVNEKHLALLLRNQTSVIEAEYNLLKRSEDAVEKQYKMFNQHLLNLEKFTTNIQKELDSQELSIEFVMSSITANSLIEHLRNVQENLIDTVTNIYNGKINLHLIAPEQLRDELNIISSQLSKDLVLPINNIQTELFHLYHLLQVKAKMTERYLIIEIKVPLINRENFEIYRTIPIPKSNDGDMVTLLPIAEMLAINIQKDSYIPMTESEIHQCIQHDTTTRLCPLQKPVYRMKSDESLCMKKREPPHCEVRHEPCRDKWFELNNANNYLYFCCQQCKIRIICGHQVSTQLLHRAGVITLHDGCIISSETFAVYPQNHQMNKMQAEVDVGPAEIPSINNIINLSVPLFKHLHENETVTEQRSLLQELGKQVEQMKAATSEDILSDHATHHDIHQYVAIYLLAAAVISAGFIYAYNRLRKHWTNQRTQEAASVPHPMPRRRSTASSVDNALFDVTDMSNTAHLSSACALDKATSPIARSRLP